MYKAACIPQNLDLLFEDMGNSNLALEIWLSSMKPEKHLLYSKDECRSQDLSDKQNKVGQ